MASTDTCLGEECEEELLQIDTRGLGLWLIPTILSTQDMGT
jgi:hypothetical protein